AYRPVGLSFYQGSYTVLGPPGPRSVPPAAPGTYNYAFASANLPLYALDIRQTPAGPVTDWAHGPPHPITLGVGGQGLTMSGSLPSWYDAIVFVRDMTPSHLLP